MYFAAGRTVDFGSVPTVFARDPTCHIPQIREIRSSLGLSDNILIDKAICQAFEGPKGAPSC